MMMNARWSIYIVDGDNEMRVLLATSLRKQNFNVVPFATAGDFLDSLGYLKPGIAVVELRIGDRLASTLLDELRSKRQDIIVIATTFGADIRTAVGAMKKGAVDFLEKPFPLRLLLSAITNLKPILSRRMAAQRRRVSVEANAQKLTTRETDIMRAIQTLGDNRLVADQLRLSVRTVEMHRANIMKKFGVARFSDILRILAEQEADPGRIPPPSVPVSAVSSDPSHNGHY